LSGRNFIISLLKRQQQNAKKDVLHFGLKKDANGRKKAFE
jgi:hypothetical protein